jgi:uncharacterized membrane-anchored protein
MLLGVLVTASPASSQHPSSEEQTTRELRSLAWQHGPTRGRIGGIATLGVDARQAFLDGPNTRRFLELNGNPPRDNHYTLVSQDANWFAVFFFEESGYVRDGETLDADALLKALQDADGPSNDERKRLGMRAIRTEGWHVPPHYDPGTKRLEWGVRLRGDDGRPVVNYTIRLLGRRGVMHATLVSDPQTLDGAITDFRRALVAYDFTQGERYSEFRSGDRVAEYGLAALVLGGAAALATKTGFFKALGKFLVPAMVAVGGAVAAFFRRFRRQA